MAVRPLILTGMAAVSQVLFLLANLLLARRLSAPDFDIFCVAVSTTLILSSLGTLGLEKYALRCLPAYRESGEVSRARGFWSFAVRTIILASVVLIGFLALGFTLHLLTPRSGPVLPVVYLALFLPAVTLALFMVEVVTASGAPMIAAGIYRLGLPITLHLLLALLWLTTLSLSGVNAAFAYGSAWLVTAFLLWVAARRVIPKDFWRSSSSYERGEWIGRALPFMVNGLLLTVFGQSGVIILKLVASSESAAGQYAVAAQLGTFVVLLSTSTNRLYLPRISVMIERGDWESLRLLARERLVLIGTLAALYLVVVIAFGRTILGFYGPGFPSAYPALCWIAAGATISTLFSIGPFYLQFVGLRAVAIGWTALAAAISVGLCFVLGNRFGATGVAIAYAVPVSLLYVMLRRIGMKDVRGRLGSSS